MNLIYIVLKELHLVREAVIEEEQARRARQSVKKRAQRRSSIEALTEAESEQRTLLGAILMRDDSLVCFYIQYYQNNGFQRSIYRERLQVWLDLLSHGFQPWLRRNKLSACFDLVTTLIMVYKGCMIFKTRGFP